MALPFGYGNDGAARISFLQLFSKVCAFVPVAQNGITRTTILCIMFEETRFYNRVQIGMEALAAKFDSGATLTPVEKSGLRNIGVGFTQVQIKDGSKDDIISGLARDPEKLKFKDVSSNNDFSVGLGCRFLLARGVQGQVGNHPRAASFKAAWLAAAPLLAKAVRDGNVPAMKVALNTAIPAATLRVPSSLSEYWSIVFPAAEMDILLSSSVRAAAW
jgi:hypothetical protein